MFAIDSLTALGEVSSRVPLSSSTFADVIHAERPLEKESCGALRRIHDDSPCGKTVNINTGPIVSLSVGRSYRLISSFHRFRFFQPPIRVDCSFARPKGLLVPFCRRWPHSVRPRSVATWLDLRTLRSASYRIFPVRISAVFNDSSCDVTL